MEKRIKRFIAVDPHQTNFRKTCQRNFQNYRRKLFTDASDVSSVRCEGGGNGEFGMGIRNSEFGMGNGEWGRGEDGMGLIGWEAVAHD